MITCFKISVDCVHNDPVDIRAGGPEILGFDFFVKSEETEEMVLFIKETLKEAKVPFINVDVIRKNIVLVEDKIWTKERIVTCIFKEANYLIREASRNYKPVSNIRKK